MCCRNKQFLDIVIIQDLHSFDSFSASVLTLECIHGHSLNVSHFCHGDHHIFSWDQIFHGNIKLIKSDGCSSLISIFFGNDKNLLLITPRSSFRSARIAFNSPDLLHQFFVLCFSFSRSRPVSARRRISTIALACTSVRSNLAINSSFAV